MPKDNDIPDVSGLTPNMESFEGIRKLRPDKMKSFIGVSALRPNASTTAQTPLATVTTRPIAGNNPTTKGK